MTKQHRTVQHTQQTEKTMCLLLVIIAVGAAAWHFRDLSKSFFDKNTKD